MEEIRCPLVDNHIIRDIDCIENIDVADGLLKESNMPDKFKVKDNWKEICIKCKMHNK